MSTSILGALAAFERQAAANGRSVHTVAQLRRHIRRLASWLQSEARSLDVAQLDAGTIAEFMCSEAALNRPDGHRKLATSANALRSSLRTFCAFVHDAGIAPANAARLLRRAVVGDPPPRALSDAEEGRLLTVLAAARGAEEQRDAVLFRLLLHAGLRLGSAVGLDVGDLDLTEGVANIRAKGGRTERVFLPAETREELTAFLTGRTTGPLFASQSGRRLTPRHVQRRFGRVRERAGLPVGVTCHSLRHRFGTALLERTGDIELVRRALTHRSVSSTQVYARCGDARLRQALRA